jgi:hypothetical protein
MTQFTSIPFRPLRKPARLGRIRRWAAGQLTCRTQPRLQVGVFRKQSIDRHGVAVPQTVIGLKPRQIVPQRLRAVQIGSTQPLGPLAEMHDL